MSIINTIESVDLHIKCHVTDNGEVRGSETDYPFKSIEIDDEGNLIYLYLGYDGYGGRLTFNTSNDGNEYHYLTHNGVTLKFYVNHGSSIVRYATHKREIDTLMAWFTGAGTEEDVEREATDMPDIF